MGPVRTQRCPVRLHALGGHASASFSDLLNPTANASSSLLARFSPHLELSRQGEPPSVQGLCCREMMIEGQEQLPPPARVWRGVRVPPSTMPAFRWSGLSGLRYTSEKICNSTDRQSGRRWLTRSPGVVMASRKRLFALEAFEQWSWA
jgi:hypothetical protein